MEDNKNLEELADEALDAVTGGAKLAHGWVCANCGQEVYAAKAKDGKAYCVPCYEKLFGSIET